MVELLRRVAELAADKQSGASGVLRQASGILTDALAEGAELERVARGLIKAQPSMASLWNVVGHALSARQHPAAFAHYVAQLERAPHTLARHAVSLLSIDEVAAPLRLVTISFSQTVLLAFQALAGRRLISVSCAEGRPALEGHRLASALASDRVPVTFYSDAGLGQALDDADAVVVGADAISPTWFLNKSGTRMLAAAAAQHGIPVYVCATRDKFVSSTVAARLTIREEPPEEVWSAPPGGVTVRNRYFEATPLDLVAAVISDAGVLGAAVVPDACTSAYDDLLLNL